MGQNNTPQEIWKALMDAQKIVLTLHYSPDGDSLGSCVAMKYALKREGKDVTLVSRDELDSALMEHRFAKEVEFGKSLADLDLESFDAIVLLDCGSDREIKEIKTNTQIINIDHHATNSHYGTLNYVDATKPSACSVLLDLFRSQNIEIDSELATRTLLGIYTDTGHFSHDDGGSLKDAAFLIAQGANYQEEIVAPIKYNTPLRFKKYLGMLYKRFEILEINGKKVGFSYVELDDAKNLGMNLAEIRGGINDLQEIGGVDLLFTLSGREDGWKGSFRTRKNLDISVLAQALGGGGHKKAAAFVLEPMSLEESKQKVVKVIENTQIPKAES